VSGSVAEVSAASSALLALIRAAEDSITAVLRKSVDTFMTQVGVNIQQSRTHCQTAQLHANSWEQLQSRMACQEYTCD
jgi:hypothetical protein